MSSPSRIGGSVREGTRVVLREITASLHNSPPMQPPYSKSGNDNSVQKIAEHEVKVRFAREFADVGSINYSTPESLSSASSFHSLSSSLSTKSSSGICPDTVPQNSNQVTDTSYTNTSIPGVDDLILGCANIHLNGEEDHSLNELQITHDLSQDQTFTSATEGADLTGDINDISLAGSENALPVIEDDSSDRHSPLNHPNDIEERPILIVPNVVVVEEPLERSVSPDRSNDLSSSPQTCSLTNVEEFSLPYSSATISNLDSTVCLSTVRESPAVSKPEKYTVVENARTETEPLALNLIPCSTIDSITSVSTLLEHAEGPSLPSISTVSLVNLTDSVKLSDGDSHESEDNVKSSLARSSSPLNVTNEVVSTSSQNVLKSPGQEIENIHRSQTESVSLSFHDATSGNENRTYLLNNTPFTIPKTLGIEEHLESTVYKETECNNASNSNLELSSNIESLKVDVSPVVTKDVDIVEETDAINAVTEIEIKEEKEEELSDEKLDRTLTFDDHSLNLESEQEVVEQYSKFKPQRQSTTLALPVEQPNFNELKSAADQVADDIFKTSLEFSEETDNFISATADIFQDPTDFDFLVTHGNSKHINRLRTESLYVKFDPLVSDTSMLPQGNSPPINEEQNGKTENTPPNIDTPKRNPAIAAIDRLLFYSPLSTSMTQKTEEPREKIEQATEEPKSETPLVNDIDMSKELELVRTTVLQLEEELKKQKKEYEAELERQKKEYEAELERQKNFFQENINKLQAQIAQEVKSKSQMTVVVEEYEKSISRLLTERERDRTNFEQEKVKLQEELQITNFHLANTEDAFNDVHQKYEKLKGVVSTYKNNEIVLKESIQENMETIKTLETRYDHLKNHAMTQLEKANLELDAMRKQHEDETVKLHAMLRKAELKSNSLAELVEQKTKENKELAQILDEVIARVGHQNADE